MVKMKGSWAGAVVLQSTNLPSTRIIPVRMPLTNKEAGVASFTSRTMASGVGSLVEQ